MLLYMYTLSIKRSYIYHSTIYRKASDGTWRAIRPPRCPSLKSSASRGT